MRETGLVALTFPGSGQPVQCDGETTGQWALQVHGLGERVVPGPGLSGSRCPGY